MPVTARTLPLLALLLLLHVDPLRAEEASDTQAVRLNPAVDRLFDAGVLEGATLQDALLRHGRHDAVDRTLLASEPRLQVAWLRLHRIPPDAWPKALSQIEPTTHALTWLELQRPAEALSVLEGLTAEHNAEPVVAAARGAAWMELGDDAAALNALEAAEAAAKAMAPQAGPDQRVAAAEVLLRLARLRGDPGPGYRAALDHLTAARETAPLNPEPRVAEALLLSEKHNLAEAAEAVLEALALNPRHLGAWTVLHGLQLDTYQFEKAEKIEQRVTAIEAEAASAATAAGVSSEAAARAILRRGRLADRLAADRLLRVGETAAARQRLAGPEADAAGLEHARLRLVAARRTGDPDAAAAAEAVLPGADGGADPQTDLYVAEILRTLYDYDGAETAMRRVLRARPADAVALPMLGELLMSTGRLEEAAEVLERATAIDPFHRGSANHLALLGRMLRWPVIDGEAFRVRSAPGPDTVLAADMARVMPKIRRRLIPLLGAATDTRTQIDLLPDATTFAVRVTGETELGALAACLGDVLAVTPPRLGREQSGMYDWANVMRHEYVHAVIFDLSDARAPRWVHEGVATRFERLDRLPERTVPLVKATVAGELIPVLELNAAFRDGRIEFGYAQADWVIEFLMTLRRDAVPEMLAAYADGLNDAAALERVVGLTAAEVDQRFTAWAAAQVRAWGLHPPPPAAEGGELPDLGVPDHPDASSQAYLIPPAVAEAWSAAEATDHPAYRFAEAVQAAHDPTLSRAAVEAAIRRLLEVRPVSRWGHRALADLLLRAGRDAEAVEPLERLDATDLRSSAWSERLSEIYGRLGEPHAAAEAAEQALYREPYNARLREMAATAWLRAGSAADARHHLWALTVLEPEVPLHRHRLEAVERMLP